MSDTPSHGPGKSIMPKWVRGPQDSVGGIALMAIALFAFWASSDLQGMHGFSFGAGTAPRMFAGLLLGLGFAVAGRRRGDRGTASGGLCLARPAVRLARHCFLCDYDPAPWAGAFGIRQFHYFGARHAGDTVEGNHHRRHLPDDRLQSAFPLCAGAAAAALPAFPGAVQGAMFELFSNLRSWFQRRPHADQSSAVSDRRAGRYAGRRAARHRHHRDGCDAAADHLRPAAGRRADHARRHLLRRAIWRLDHRRSWSIFPAKRPRS